jgi:HEAT repeat protein
MGAVNARDLRAVTVSDVVFDALVHGLAHDNPSVRFWSVQLLDDCPDPRAIAAIAPLLDDPVPRVRRNASMRWGVECASPHGRASSTATSSAGSGRCRRPT